MEKRYQIIFLDLLAGADDFKDRMLRFGVAQETSQKIIDKAPVILKQNLSLKDARSYADAISGAGGRVSIRDSGILEDDGRNDSWFNMVPLKYFTACPQCGYKQLKKAACIKCGLFFEDIAPVSRQL
jgi:hypothetical protein